MQPAACGEMHRAAVKCHMARNSVCRQCPIGRRHAGKENDPEAGIAPKAYTCTRCGSQGTRMIPKYRLCVSCYNREREAARGRNAKNKRPVNFKPLRPRLAGVMIEGQPAWILPQCQNETEPMARSVLMNGANGVHDQQPAEVAWHTDYHRWEYRDDEGHALVLGAVSDGMLAMRPVGFGEAPTAPMQTSSTMTAGELTTWLRLIGDEAELASEYQHQPHVCASCEAGVLRARKKAGRIEVICPTCKASEG